MKSGLANKVKRLINKLYCPLTSAFIQIIAVFVVIKLFLFPVNVAEVRSQINKIINQCGKDYSMAWITIKPTLGDDTYTFKDVIGCNEEKRGDCSFSIKESGLNPFYQKSHIIDHESYIFLSTMKTGDVGYYSSMDYLKQYPAINEIITKTNFPILAAGFTVVKDIRSNIVHIFTLSKIGNSNKCNQKITSELLNNLANKAKGGNYE